MEVPFPQFFNFRRQKCWQSGYVWQNTSWDLGPENVQNLFTNPKNIFRDHKFRCHAWSFLKILRHLQVKNVMP